MRNYKRKTYFKHINPALFEQARGLIEGGMSIRGAAATIGVADSSLRARLKKGAGSEKHGRFRTIFTKEQEDDLVKHCLDLDKRFFGLTLKSLRFLLYTYATKNGINHRFSDVSKLAGKDFTRAFMKRNKLSLRVPRKTSVARIMGFNRTQLNTYFENLEAAMIKHGFTPDRIYNVDETGIQTVPNKLPKHVAPTGKREVGKTVAAEQGQTVSVACAVSATGHHVPTIPTKKKKEVTREKVTKRAKVKKQLFAKRLKTTPDSATSSDKDSSDYSVHNSSSDLNMSFSAEEEEDQTLMEVADIGQQSTSRNNGILQLQKDDFAVMKVQGKTKFSFRLYVVKVVSVYNDGVEGVPNSQRFSETPEEAFFDIGDVKMKLTPPVVHKNARFQNTLSFHEDLAGVH